MAQNRMQERIRSSALGTAIMSLVAFYLGDRIGAYIVFGLDMQLGSQVTRGLQALIAKPLYLDLNMMPLLYGFILCAIVWLVWLRYVVFVGKISASEAVPGDVVCSEGHTGIYIGGGQMIHAPHTGDVVKIGPVQSNMNYYRYNG